MRATRGRSLWVLLGSTVLLAVACGGSGGGDDEGGTGVQGTLGDQEIFETFVDTIYQDASVTDADWGQTTLGTLEGLPVSSRTAYVYSYLETSSGVDSGRGQYVEYPTPLTGADYTPGLMEPAVAQGRRVQWAFSDAQLGAKGTITAVAWGPARNATVAASYPNVRLRMGYQAQSSLTLTPPFSGSFSGTPALLYDGPYQVAANANVGNTTGQPTISHVGGYPESIPCSGAGGSYNAPLFQHTGWYPWPALTQGFSWDPGDPQITGDRILVFDASVQAGDFTQKLRGWFGVTYPCSGLLIAGVPRSRMVTTYEADVPDPPESFTAGILNPEPAVNDMRFTFTRLESTAQSLFYASAYEADTDYGDPVLVPSTQSGGAGIVLEFQGAHAVGSDGATIDTSQGFTDWSEDIDDCDGMPYIRFRVTLLANGTTSAVAKLQSITIPLGDLDP